MAGTTATHTSQRTTTDCGPRSTMAILDLAVAGPVNARSRIHKISIKKAAVCLGWMTIRWRPRRLRAGSRQARMNERRHILVVDDEPQITRVLRTSLSAHGY